MTQLSKLTIKVYVNSNRIERVKNSKDEDEKFEVMFNPEDYNITYITHYNDTVGIGEGAKELQYRGNPSGQLRLKLLLDAPYRPQKTATSGKPTTVKDRIEHLKAIAVTENPDTKEPNYLTISWGDLNYNCRLTNLTINYTLFNGEGHVLHAELDCVFTEDKYAPIKTGVTSAYQDLTDTSIENPQEMQKLHQLSSVSNNMNIDIETIAKRNDLNSIRYVIKEGTNIIIP